MELFPFDKAYVDRLRNGDQPTEQHFVSYFERLLRIKLRARMFASETAEELRQETLARVITALRAQGGVRQPERFGAFVNAICNNVVLEFYRSSSRSQPLEDSHLEKTDKILNVEDRFVTQEMNAQVRRILDTLPKRDRQLLRAIFLEEKDKDEVCRLFHVDRDYLRVLVHRAKDRFRDHYVKDQTAMAAKAIGRRNA